LLGKRKTNKLEDKYRGLGMRKRMLSPSRHDALKGDVTPNVNSRNYKEIMRE
jgi:hypothetical protein